MNKSLAVYPAALALALMLPRTALAGSYSATLSDGVLVTMDVQSTQTVLTLVGQPNANYRIDGTAQLDGWTTLTNATLNASGTLSTWIAANCLPAFIACSVQ